MLSSGRSIEKFWSKVQKTDECWNWVGSLRGRYGDFYWKGDRMAAHRFVWELSFGPIPAGLCVLHKCDNPKCVRPEHLFVGTVGDNTRDMIKKGRGRVNKQYGEDNAHARLTEAQVRKIKQLKGDIGQRRLAEMFAISVSNIQMIHTGRTWAHVDVPMRDRMAHPRGEKNGRAKLTKEKAREIRNMRGHKSYAEIALDFNVSADTISRVMNGAWA